MKQVSNIPLLVVVLTLANMQAVGAEESARQTGFKRPQASHRTSKPVPTPWLGYGSDDSPAVRDATYLKSPEEIRAMAERVEKKPQGSLSYPKGSGTADRRDGT